MIALPCTCGHSIEEYLGGGQCPCIAYEADELAGVHPDSVKKFVDVMLFGKGLGPKPAGAIVCTRSKRRRRRR
jgi:hypothetical protein